jgi:hypothetical protein
MPNSSSRREAYIVVMPCPCQAIHRETSGASGELKKMTARVDNGGVMRYSVTYERVYAVLQNADGNECQPSSNFRAFPAY